MTIRIAALTSVAHVAMVLAAFAIVRALGRADPLLALILADILATQVATATHHRVRGTIPSNAVKMQTGLLLAALSSIEGLVLQAAIGWMVHPDVTIPIATIGAILFPFGLMKTMSAAFVKRDAARGGPA